MVIEVDLFEHLFDIIICLLAEWINILPDGALKQERLLWDVGNIFSERMKSKF